MSIDITKQINDLTNKLKKRNAKELIPLPNTGPVTFSDESYDELKKYLGTESFDDRTVITRMVFDYLQTILELGVVPNKRQIELADNLARKCQNYSDNQRSDLIPHIRPILFKKDDLRIECFINHLEQLNPLNLEQASKEKLEKFNDYIQRSGVTKKMVEDKINTNPQILDALQINPNFTGNLEKSFLTNINLSSKIRNNMSNTTQTNNVATQKSTIRNMNTRNNSNKNIANVKLVPGNTASEQLMSVDIPLPPSSENIQSTSYTSKRNKMNLSESAPNQTDIQDMLDRISRHLKKLDTGKDLESSTPVRILEIPDNAGNIVARISVECLLNHSSADKSYPRLQNNDECTAAVRNYLNAEGNMIDLKKLIDTSLRDENATDFVTSTDFYKNLYNFNISMVSYIANDVDFKNLTADSQRTVLQGVQDFISQSVQYLSAYMATYRVINDDLLKSSYDLLYLMNTLTFRTASVGRTIDDLILLYDRLVTAISDNITIYNGIDKDKLKQYKDLEPTDQTARDITNLYAELTSRLDLLSSQKEQLQKNVALINTDSNNLQQFATSNVKDIVSKIDTRAIYRSVPTTTEQISRTNNANVVTRTNNANVTVGNNQTSATKTETSPPPPAAVTQGSSGNIGQNGGYLTGPTTGSTVPSTTNRSGRRRF
ncbi:hypothetical protein QJ856_gp0470 [Tupanvirus deep ocean]|uniref:Uncharacterized protein n=2 Tax=Tupanvirus TaxID=2094720 RepID=A0AC62A931_9VIRU|nr:hypothetical protein QJ856_gp0470 [Tupanvirus deep ocean]QKU34274.1 hypothetical protein [Tupanvirus deep ocean]